MVTNNFYEEPTSMTRGTPYVIYKKDGELWLGSSEEFNGDMYPGGHYEKLRDHLKTVNTYEDFGISIHRFNNEAHKYSDLQIYQEKLSDKTGNNDPVIDFRVEYYNKWFSDYIFIINLSEENFTIFDTKDKKITLPHYVGVILHFGEMEEIITNSEYYKVWRPNRIFNDTDYKELLTYQVGQLPTIHTSTTSLSGLPLKDQN